MWRHRWRHHHENIFSCIIWDDLFISDVKLKLCLIFWHFQNGRHFELTTKFFTGSDTGSWICYKDNHEHSWHFELLIDVLTQILTELFEFKVLTYFETLWRHQWSNPWSFVKAYSQFNDTLVHLVWRWYLCKFFSYHEKCYFAFIKEWNDFEVVLWRQRWRHHHENNFSCMIWDDLFISDVKLKLCLIFWHFQNGRHLSSWRNILPEVTPEVEYATKITMSIRDILSFWSMF